MNRNRKLEQWQIKYLVKSPLIYYSFLVLFIAVFLYVSLTLNIDIRKSFLANMSCNEISIKTEKKIHSEDDIIYIYKNRNEKIISQSILDSKYSNGTMYFYIDENEQALSGNVTIEIKTGEQSLFAKIFLKAGTDEK